MRLNVSRMIAELHSEVELIGVAIRALERFEDSIGVEEDDSTAPQQESKQADTERASHRSRSLEQRRNDPPKGAWVVLVLLEGLPLRSHSISAENTSKIC